MVGETVSVSLLVENLGQTLLAHLQWHFYDGNPDGEGVLLQSVSLAVPGGGESTATLAWTPTSPGLYRLFTLTDKERVVNEADRGNNLSWRDVYVGFAGPLLLDSGGATDPVYSTETGYGVLDENPLDFIGTCFPTSYESYRLEYAGRVVYLFNHLLQAISTI